MPKRNRENAARPDGPRDDPGRDLLWIVAAGTFIVASFVLVGLGEPIAERVADLPTGVVAGVVAALMVIPLGAALYASRRQRVAESAKAQLEQLAYLDPLTGLRNRRFLTTEFDEMLRQARRTNARLGVFFVDLDGFKTINDRHGHDVGDALMVAVSRRMQATLAMADVLLRYGGDEFVVICPDISNPTSAERVARRLLRAIEEPVTRGEVSLQVSASIGVAITEERCTRPDEVLRDADAAMYQAKAEGPGRFALFDRSRRDSMTPSTAERRLREALANGEFRLYYQPMVSLWTKRLVGVEALLRWNDPARGMVQPGDFLPALEQSGLIVPIGKWILEEVCRQSRAWGEAYPNRPPLNIKLNISARQLAQANFADQVAEALRSTGASADHLCLEVTEGALMHDLTTAWTTVREVKALGVSLALDDFGTGYASLTYLRQFSIDLLTLDKSFVDGVGISREDTTIVEHVIGLAKALGIVTVAEGVETEEQVELLRSLNCDLAQGFYFSHPQPPDVIDELLEADGNRQEWRPPARTTQADDASAAVVAVDGRFSGASS